MRLDSVREYERRIKSIIITEDEIKDGLKRAGEYINSLYDGNPILLVSVLKGAFVFMADLCREVTVPCEIGFMCVKSYFEGTSSTGDVNVVMDLDRDVKDYHLVVVEDIIDTGRTLKRLVEMLKDRKPLSLNVVTLLDKPDRRVTDVKVDYCAFEIEDKFVVGCGMDYKQRYRNLPYIGEVVLDE
jgi:hypoxanthine phosphoribosyltransferase